MPRWMKYKKANIGKGRLISVKILVEANQYLTSTDQLSVNTAQLTVKDD